MASRTLELFDKPRQPRQWRMHVIDAGGSPAEPVVRYQCHRCNHETDWMVAASVTASKRGIPCPKCNAQPLKT